MLAPAFLAAVVPARLKRQTALQLLEAGTRNQAPLPWKSETGSRDSMSFRVEGIGTAVPRYAVDQAQAAEMAKLFCGRAPARQRLLPMLYRRAGVRRRHSVVLEPAGSALAAVECGPSDAVHHRPRGATSAPGDRTAETAGVVAPAGPSICKPFPAGGSTHDCRQSGRLFPTESPPLADRPSEAVTQSFYEPARSDEDCGPTTAQRMQLYERWAVHLAREAAGRALRRAAVVAEQVTHLVTVSCTGFSAPGFDLQLIEQLGLPAGVARTHVGFMGCHGAMNGLRVAKAFAESDSESRVLLCAVELCSLHQQYGWHPERIVANALFADGAAAVVGKGDSRRNTTSWRIVASGSTVLPDSGDLMSWRVGDHGFEMTLSPQVPDLIRRDVRHWLQRWLASSGLAIGDVPSWVIHPGGPRILKACAEALGLSDEQMRPSQQVLAEFGNMSSPTVLFILERLMQADAGRPCVMLAFGPGLTIEAALLA